MSKLPYENVSDACYEPTQTSQRHIEWLQNAILSWIYLPSEGDQDVLPGVSLETPCFLQVGHGVEQAHRGVRLAGGTARTSWSSGFSLQRNGSTYKTSQRHPTDWTGGHGKALQGPVWSSLSGQPTWSHRCLPVDMQPCLTDILAALLTGNGELTGSAGFSAYIWTSNVLLIATAFAKCIKYDLLL